MKPAHREITQAELHEVLNYDMDTGIFTWRSPRSHRVKVNEVAGSKSNRGYIRINWKCRMVSAHRLAWLYVTGEFPMSIVDHINGVRDDNRFANLRLTDKVGNAQNIKKTFSNNRSGYLGVSAKGGIWISQIRHQGRKLHLGYFKTPEEAHAKYLEKKRELHSFNTI